jgi:protein-disulfide isomerase
MFKKETLPVIPSKDMVMGFLEAPVQLTMFGDYESLQTKELYEIIKDVLETFKGKVNFTFRHFPLTRIHQKAHKAAEAAIAAGQEGKFWEMHEQLMAHPHELGIISLKGHAREVGVKNKKFLDQLMNSDFGWQVQDDLREGIAMGIRDIPALLINGKFIDRPLTLKRINKAIREILMEQNQGMNSENKHAA